MIRIVNANMIAVGIGPDARYTYIRTNDFLAHFSLDTLRDLPDIEALEEGSLLSKKKLLADDIPLGLAGGEGGGEEEAGEDIVGDLFSPGI